jgi:hypothetical protein
VSVKRRTAVRILKHPSDLPPDHPAYEIAGEILPASVPAKAIWCSSNRKTSTGTCPCPNCPPSRPIDWEGVSRDRGYFHAVHLTNNEFGIGFLIPDSVDGPLRARLEEHL